MQNKNKHIIFINKNCFLDIKELKDKTFKETNFNNYLSYSDLTKDDFVFINFTNNIDIVYPKKLRWHYLFPEDNKEINYQNIINHYKWDPIKKEWLLKQHKEYI